MGDIVRAAISLVAAYFIVGAGYAVYETHNRADFISQARIARQIVQQHLSYRDHPTANDHRSLIHTLNELNHIIDEYDHHLWRRYAYITAAWGVILLEEVLAPTIPESLQREFARCHDLYVIIAQSESPCLSVSDQHAEITLLG